MDEWISISEKGLPTDNKVGYFIARDEFFHRTLYHLSDVLEKFKEFEITHYLPFNLPNPPKK